MKISVVIAAYNEEQNIGPLTEKLFATLEKTKIPFEIVYAIAGRDKTCSIAQQWKRKKGKMKILYSLDPEGFGNAFRKGFNAIADDTTHVLTMDADLNHDPADIPRLIEASTTADLVIGSRELHESRVYNFPLWKRFISKLTNYVFLTITGIKIKDKTSGYRFMRREVLYNIGKQVQSKNFEYLTEFLIKTWRAGYTIREVPITFTYRQYGKSKMSIVKTGLGYLKLLLKMLR